MLKIIAIVIVVLIGGVLIATNIVWAMQGHTPYFAKIIHVFIDMDSMVGKDFEAGLAALKAIAEK